MTLSIETQIAIVRREVRHHEQMVTAAATPKEKQIAQGRLAGMRAVLETLQRLPGMMLVAKRDLPHLDGYGRDY